jgi:hypothetical protein
MNLKDQGAAAPFFVCGFLSRHEFLTGIEWETRRITLRFGLITVLCGAHPGRRWLRN